MKANMFPLILSRFLWITFYTSMCFTALILSLSKTFLIEWDILVFYSTTISLPLVLDPFSMIFATTVTLISANVMSFAMTYMLHEPQLKRFSLLVLLFIMSMLMLIFIPNLVALLIGWDGLGLVSFLLVIYYQNPKSLGAGMITAMTNRIGDVMILLAIAMSMTQGHWNLFTFWESSFQPYIALLLMTAAMTKSAQVPFSSWLPAAMAAPTPVSALVHSSTLVTAGVFLMIRFYPFLHLSPLFHFILTISAILTMTMASMNAMAETDMKKIIALSTLSQLGVMMASLSMSLPKLAFFHLITHAMFKALLFITAGTLIHLHHHSQELRAMGNLTLQMPLTMAALLASNLALSGFPFLAGFYSKDMILESLMFTQSNAPATTLFLVGAALTAAYSMRLTMTVILAPNKNIPLHMVTDNDKYVSSPMIFLSLGALMGGALLNWTFFNPLPHPVLPPLMKMTPMILMFMGAVTAYAINLTTTPLWHHLTHQHNMNTLMWFLTPLSSQNMLPGPLTLAHLNLKLLDHGWHEMYGPQGIYHVLYTASGATSQQQKMFTTSHLTFIILSIMYIYFI
nr:NADH dehydrogenase subunit 5 [Oxydromus sp. PA-2020]